MFTMLTALVKAVISLSLITSVLPGANAVPHGFKNTEIVSLASKHGVTPPAASGATLDRSLYLPAGNPPPLPVELNVQVGTGIPHLDSRETSLCPDLASKDVALTDPGTTQYSVSFRVACGVDFYGGDLHERPASTDGGPNACFAVCQRTSRCVAVVFAPLEGSALIGDCWLKGTVSDASPHAGFAALVKRPDVVPNVALVTEEVPWYEAASRLSDGPPLVMATASPLPLSVVGSPLVSSPASTPVVLVQVSTSAAEPSSLVVSPASLRTPSSPSVSSLTSRATIASSSLTVSASPSSVSSISVSTHSSVSHNGTTSTEPAISFARTIALAHVVMPSGPAPWVAASFVAVPSEAWTRSAAGISTSTSASSARATLAKSAVSALTLVAADALSAAALPPVVSFSEASSVADHFKALEEGALDDEAAFGKWLVELDEEDDIAGFTSNAVEAPTTTDIVVPSAETPALAMTKVSSTSPAQEQVATIPPSFGRPCSDLYDVAWEEQLRQCNAWELTHGVAPLETSLSYALGLPTGAFTASVPASTADVVSPPAPSGTSLAGGVTRRPLVEQLEDNKKDVKGGEDATHGEDEQEDPSVPARDSYPSGTKTLTTFRTLTTHPGSIMIKTRTATPSAKPSPALGTLPTVTIQVHSLPVKPTVTLDTLVAVYTTFPAADPPTSSSAGEVSPPTTTSPPNPLWIPASIMPSAKTTTVPCKKLPGVNCGEEESTVVTMPALAPTPSVVPEAGTPVLTQASEARTPSSSPLVTKTLRIPAHIIPEQKTTTMSCARIPGAGCESAVVVYATMETFDVPRMTATPVFAPGDVAAQGSVWMPMETGAVVPSVPVAVPPEPTPEDQALPVSVPGGSAPEPEALSVDDGEGQDESGYTPEDQALPASVPGGSAPEPETLSADIGEGQDDSGPAPEDHVQPVNVPGAQDDAAPAPAPSIYVHHDASTTAASPPTTEPSLPSDVSPVSSPLSSDVSSTTSSLPSSLTGTITSRASTSATTKPSSTSPKTPPMSTHRAPWETMPGAASHSHASPLRLFGASLLAILFALV